MKAILMTALIAVSVSVGFNAAQAATVEELLVQAKQSFAEREYDNAGVAKAQASADLYAQAASDKAVSKFNKVAALAGQAEALYFVANVNPATDVKIAKHWEGFTAAETVVKMFGVNDVTNVSDATVASLKALPADQLKIFAEALFQRGINLGQWGAASGVAQSLGRWPELRSNMELIVKIGFKDLHEYGAYRTLGLGFYKIPALLGGSMAKADKYLSTAVSGSLAAGQTYSINGYNNVFYAQILRDNGSAAKAKELLQNFLKADANTLNPGNAPETKAAQREATELLKTM